MGDEEVRLLHKAEDVVPHMRLWSVALIGKVTADLYVTSKYNLRVGILMLDQWDERRELGIVDDDYAVVEQVFGIRQPKLFEISLGPTFEVLLVIRHQVFVWFGDSLQDIVKVFCYGENTRMS